MPLDALVVTALAGELRRELTGARVDRIVQPARDEIQLALHTASGNVKLLISAGMRYPRVHLTTVARENPALPPMFCMLLRKHLQGARLCGLTQPPLERVLDLEWECVDELGEPVRRHLICELMGRHSNVILVGSDGRIMDCMRRVDSEMSERRQVLPGLFYALPPGQGKLSPMAVSEDELAALWTQKPPETPPEDWLLHTFGGLSPLICRELAFQGMPEALLRLRRTVWEGMFTPFMLCEKDEIKDFSCVPIGQYGALYSCRQAQSFSALLDEFYTKGDQREHMRQRGQSLQKTAAANRDRALRRVALQEQELAQAMNRERLREYGDLLMANLHIVGRGAAQVEVEDFYHPECARAVIALDAHKSPQQNAAKYYKDYAKAKNAEQLLAIQMERGRQEAQYWESVLEELGRVSSEKELTEIHEELSPPPRSRKQKEKVPQPHAFVSTEGIRFYAGHNNRQNDYLTFRLAARGDLWMHAQKFPGCHVVIDCSERRPGDDTLLEAAVVAATLSQGRNSPKVPVDYTLVRHVKKPPAAAAGMVIYDQFKTILVEPDEALLTRLRREDRRR